MTPDRWSIPSFALEEKQHPYGCAQCELAKSVASDVNLCGLALAGITDFVGASLTRSHGCRVALFALRRVALVIDTGEVIYTLIEHLRFHHPYNIAYDTPMSTALNKASFFEHRE